MTNKDFNYLITEDCAIVIDDMLTVYGYADWTGSRQIRLVITSGYRLESAIKNSFNVTADTKEELYKNILAAIEEYSENVRDNITRCFNVKK